mmetsp:Transcript_8518/g.16068  ORF Transcript_8518/g.16068 Transcript_8518/m.16068 type:complete len:98 (+) Transcript_8518:543-836(+)
MQGFEYIQAAFAEYERMNPESSSEEFRPDPAKEHQWMMIEKMLPPIARDTPMSTEQYERICELISEGSTDEDSYRHPQLDRPEPKEEALDDIMNLLA